MTAVGRRLAFDYGDIRTGVAISDPHGILVTPHATLLTQSETFLATLQELVSEVVPLYIAVGSPLHLSGEASAKMESVSLFVDILKGLTEVPIHLIDERLTTVTAQGRMRDAGKSLKESKSMIDSVAAATILEQALRAEKNGTLTQ
jgi:putative Holliday junction resolvase